MTSKCEINDESFKNMRMEVLVFVQKHAAEAFGNRFDLELSDMVKKFDKKLADEDASDVLKCFGLEEISSMIGRIRDITMQIDDKVAELRLEAEGKTVEQADQEAIEELRERTRRSR
jgi:hypothetical protein